MSNITRKNANWADLQYRKRKMYLVAYYQANRDTMLSAANEWNHTNSERLANNRQCKKDIKSAYDKARYMEKELG